MDVCLYLHACKKRKRAEEERDGAKEDLGKVAVGWNRRSLRVGDMIGDYVSTVGDRGRKNDWDLNSVLRLAWQGLGKFCVYREGIDGTHDALGIAATVASSLWHCQDECTLLARQECESASEIPAFLKEFDGTPSFVKFGNHLQEQLQLHARYPVLGDDGKWKTMRLGEYRSHTGNAKILGRGVLDLFVCNLDLCWMGEDKVMHGSRNFGRPMFLQHGNSSCMHSAAAHKARANI